MKTLVQRMPVPTRVPIAGNRGGNASTQMELSARQPKFENASTAGYESVVSTQPEDEGYPVRDGTGYASGYTTHNWRKQKLTQMGSLRTWRLHSQTRLGYKMRIHQVIG
jgi:hypothetical protein